MRTVDKYPGSDYLPIRADVSNDFIVVKRLFVSSSTPTCSVLFSRNLKAPPTARFRFHDYY